MENTYKLYNTIELNSVKKISPLPKGWEKRLSNKEFTNGAPVHILEGAKKQLLENQKELEMLQESLKLL